MYAHCHIIMPVEDKILKYDQDKKSFNTLSVIYADTGSLLTKITTCNTYEDESSTTKISKNTACGYSLFTHYSFGSSRSKHMFYRSADYTEKFCADPRKHATGKINCINKEILLLTDEEIESYNNQKFCHICKNMFHEVDDSDDNSNHYNNDDDDSNDDEFNVRKFHGDAAGHDDVDDNDYYDHYGECDARKFHGDAALLDDVDDDDYHDYDDAEFHSRKFHDDAAGLNDIDDYVEEFDGLRFHSVNQNYEGVSWSEITQKSTKVLHIVSAI